MAKSRALTIRLIKNGITDDQIFKSSQKLKAIKLKDNLEFKGTIFFKPSANKSPSWVTFLNSGSAQTINGLFSAQAAALLIAITKKGRFAISFGHSWQWLDENAIERRFGLIAALNCIEDDQIKLVDAQQIDSLALSRRSQTSHSSELFAFGLDIRRDLMKAIVGRPKSTDIGKTIMGADALRIVSKIDFEEIGKKCDQLFELSQKKDYKKTYGWIDNIEIVKAPAEKLALDEILLKSINSRETNNIFLAPPRIKDLNADEEYSFHFDKEGSDNRFDVDFDDLMKGIEPALPIDLNFLKKHRIQVYSAASEQPVDSFNIYSGLVFEARQANSLSCLIDGDWYKIANSHVDFIDKRIKEITKSTIKLPNAKRNEKEGDYNIRAAATLNALCLDKKNISYGGGASKIEICDVLTDAPCFIHVKKASSSQLLSHLFNQGVVSGQFLLEEEFRKECIKKVSATYHKFFSNPYSAEKVTITFGIISSKATDLPDRLPFFSKQTLINAVELLKKFNYKIDLRGIEIDGSA